MYAGTVLADSDITRISCNFFNKETHRYEGVDVRTNHNDLSFDMVQTYHWPKVVCDVNTTVDTVTISKSIPSIIQTDVDGYSRYRPFQQPSNINKLIKDKGQLTNITYEGAYEVLDGNIHTVNDDYAGDGSHAQSIVKMEQLDRVQFQGTPNYTAKDHAQIINDRERIHLFDRIPQYSKNYGNSYRTVSNPMLPQKDSDTPDQKRSLWSSAGTLFVLDEDMGVIAISSRGEVVE